MNVPKYHDLLVDQLGSCILHGGTSLREVPALLKKVVDEGAWRHRVIRQTGEVVEFERFEEFVATAPIEGLGTDLRTLKRLCADDPEALGRLEEVTQREHGGDRKSEAFKLDNINVEPAESPNGTDRQYAIRKLRKDRPDLHERVLAGEVSPHAAMIEAGFRRRTLTIPLDPRRAAQAIRRHFDADQLAEFLKELEGG